MPRKKNPETRPRPGGKEAVTVRITPEARRRWRDAAARLGIPLSAWLELIIREKTKGE